MRATCTRHRLRRDQLELRSAAFLRACASDRASGRPPSVTRAFPRPMTLRHRSAPALRPLIGHLRDTAPLEGRILPGRKWRLRSESNRRPRLCRPLHNHSATQPKSRKYIGAVDACHPMFFIREWRTTLSQDRRQRTLRVRRSGPHPEADRQVQGPARRRRSPSGRQRRSWPEDSVRLNLL